MFPTCLTGPPVHDWLGEMGTSPGDGHGEATLTESRRTNSTRVQDGAGEHVEPFGEQVRGDDQGRQ
jgi:hypothetical protein